MKTCKSIDEDPLQGNSYPQVLDDYSRYLFGFVQIYEVKPDTNSDELGMHINNDYFMLKLRFVSLDSGMGTKRKKIFATRTDDFMMEYLETYIMNANIAMTIITNPGN